MPIVCLFILGMSQLQCLLCNFIWSGCDGIGDARACAAWPTSNMPRSQRHSGIVDLDMQSGALLAELFVKGNGNVPWSMLSIVCAKTRTL